LAARSSIPGSRSRIVRCQILTLRKSSMPTGSISCRSGVAGSSAVEWGVSPMQSLAVGRFPALRWSNGYPFSVQSGMGHELPAGNSGRAVSSARPKTGSFIVAQASGGTGPNVFQDPGITDATTNPNAPSTCSVLHIPAKEGLRNGLRGPGTLILILAWRRPGP